MCLKKIPIVFHNRSNYDYYHSIIKELVEDFEKQFTCLGENTEKYTAFTVLIEKDVTRIDKNVEETTKEYLTYLTSCSLLIAHDLLQVLCQILPIFLWSSS